MADEFAGTERATAGNGGDGGSSGDGPIDPATFAANSGGGNSGGNPDDGFVYDGDGKPVYNKDGSRKRKRGRRAGTGAGAGGTRKDASAADLKRSVEVLAGSLALVHTAIAAFTQTPEIALEPEEAKSLAEASAAVMREFDLQPDPKTQALVGLVMVSATIYGPRVYLIRERKINEARAAESGEAIVVNTDGSSTVTAFKVAG